MTGIATVESITRVIHRDLNPAVTSVISLSVPTCPPTFEQRVGRLMEELLDSDETGQRGKTPTKSRVQGFR